MTENQQQQLDLPQMSVSRTFKIIVVGDQGVGKSSILARYLKKEFHPQYSVTIGVEFLSRTLPLPEGEASLQIWDTAGQEAFRSIIKNFYRGASGVLLVFSLTSKESLGALKRWVTDIQESTSPLIYKVLVGSKQDMHEKRVVTEEMALSQLQQIKGEFYIETSAKENFRIEELFEKTARGMMQRASKSMQFLRMIPQSSLSKSTASSLFVLEEQKKKEEKKCQC